jgi:hypothetical protein
MALPDFFVAGAPKAGTTAVHAARARHPALFMSAVKEPKFFLTDGPPPTRGGPGDVQTYREHIWRREDYEALFEAAPAGVLRGESTPFYLYNRDAQRRIRALVPHAKLIVILRDPVERAHSNWTHPRTRTRRCGTARSPRPCGQSARSAQRCPSTPDRASPTISSGSFSRTPRRESR